MMYRLANVAIGVTAWLSFIALIWLNLFHVITFSQTWLPAIMFAFIGWYATDEARK
jgi:hypothetical protein